MTHSIIHLIVRKVPAGFYATSPQAPGFLYGRESLKDLRTDLQEALAFHFDRPGPFRIIEHHEQHYDIADGELVTRIALDEYFDQREAVYERLADVLKDQAQAYSLTHGLRNSVGESVYVCALPQDTLGWLMDQLVEQGDALSAAILVADHMLLTLPFAYGDQYEGVDDTFRLTDSGWFRETPLSQIIQATNVVAPFPRTPITHDRATDIRR